MNTTPENKSYNQQPDRLKYQHLGTWW